MSIGSVKKVLWDFSFFPLFFNFNINSKSILGKEIIKNMIESPDFLVG